VNAVLSHQSLVALTNSWNAAAKAGEPAKSNTISAPNAGNATSASSAGGANTVAQDDGDSKQQGNKEKETEQTASNSMPSASPTFGNTCIRCWPSIMLQSHSCFFYCWWLCYLRRSTMIR